MRVKCVLCDQVDVIDDDSPLAKRLRNRPIHTYMCHECHERITKRTNERMNTGRFKLYRDQKSEKKW
ncbi:YlaI family protein [Bacillus alveayuensis]|uniref:YlaI family protein n=1 Tax=Aeribacillus alveayuensis TaxID=279215 RepID=UPI0005CDBED4|nr:YlaI family protein [Bacillus alveayuensis]